MLRKPEMDATAILEKVAKLNEEAFDLKQELEKSQQQNDDLGKEKPTPPYIDTKDLKIKFAAFKKLMLAFSKHVVPHIARCCLISTFFEESVGTSKELQKQKDTFSASWSLYSFLKSLFISVYLLVQTAGCITVLIRLKVSISCGILFGIISLQTIYFIFTKDGHFLMRNLVLAGCLLLLLAEDTPKQKLLFDGFPFAVPRHYVQLGCQFFLNAVACGILFLSFNSTYWLNLIGAILIVCIVIGFKTRLSTIALVVWLACLNCYFNDWWNFSDFEKSRRDLRCNFFMTISVVGGLLMAAFGPDGTRMDLQ